MYIHFWNTRRIREKGTEEILGVRMAENFPKLMTDTRPLIQDLSREH